MSFLYPTLHDHLKKLNGPVDALGISELKGMAQNISPGERVRCECGRWELVINMIDVRPLPEEVRPHGADFICPPCKELLHLEGHMTHEEFATHHKAPQWHKNRMKGHDDELKNFEPPKNKHLPLGKKNK